VIGYSRQRTVVIPNGFDCDLFRPDPTARVAVRRELGVPDAAPLIGFVARYHPVKDHGNFIAAAARLATISPDTRFLLVGNRLSSGNKELMAEISAAGVAGRVHCLGERADTNRLNAAMDVATCCSLAESFPNVVGEAMACGIPCVVTDVGDCARIVGNSGLVVPPGDAEALCGAWASLLSAGAQTRRSLGDTARQRVVDLYSLGSTVAAYEELYGRLLDRPFAESRPRQAAD
jgi:glycosyltransferase involved in cell wall biosynthesis